MTTLIYPELQDGRKADFIIFTPQNTGLSDGEEIRLSDATKMHLTARFEKRVYDAALSSVGRNVLVYRRVPGTQRHEYTAAHHFVHPQNVTTTGAILTYYFTDDCDADVKCVVSLTNGTGLIFERTESFL